MLQAAAGSTGSQCLLPWVHFPSEGATDPLEEGDNDAVAHYVKMRVAYQS